MRFLLDQDVYAITMKYLKDLGHDVVPVTQLGLSKAEDSKLLEEAQNQNRILVTRDRDFGSLVFVSGLGTGVIYLRLLPSNQHAAHKELERVLNSYTENDLKRAFVVVEPGRHRFRRIVNV